MPPSDAAAAHDAINWPRLRAYRLGRVRQQLVQRGYAACVLVDPINIRYATDSRNMTVWCLHNPVRYCFIAAEGPVVLFETHGCSHLSSHLDLIDEIRPAIAWYYFSSGPHVEASAVRWADEIADLVRLHGGGNRRIAIDRCDPAGLHALASHEISVGDGQEVLEQARLIKSADELACIKESIGAAQVGMARMHEALEPGMTEQELWALLHQANIEKGGEWIETRLLSSGPRTNPWMRECSDRRIQAGELVSFDTDLVGPHGYCADISRCFLAGDAPATPVQQDLYGLALEQIHHNMTLLEPGLSFRELAERAWPIPDIYAANRYAFILHGIGMCDEYPGVAHRRDFASGYDGVLESGMTVCVESYIGAEGGAEGVKLEQQVLLTDSGAELLSTFPLEERLLRGGGVPG